MSAVPLPQPAPSLPHHRSPTAGQAEGSYEFPAPLPPVSGVGPIGSGLLHEDEEVRVWENRLEAASDGPLHTHDADYWLLTGQSGGSARLGNVLYVRNGYKEVASNPQPDYTAFYLVELKRTEPKAGEPTDWGRDGRDDPAPAQPGSEPPAMRTLPPGSGATSAVLFENVELRVWDVRVPPGETGTVPVDALSPSVFTCDVRGKRDTALDLMELATLGSHASPNLGNPKKYGSTYHSAAGSGEVRGEAVNVGEDELRCIVVEIKAPQAAKL